MMPLPPAPPELRSADDPGLPDAAPPLLRRLEDPGCVTEAGEPKPGWCSPMAAAVTAAVAMDMGGGCASGTTLLLKRDVRAKCCKHRAYVGEHDERQSTEQHGGSSCYGYGRRLNQLMRDVRWQRNEFKACVTSKYLAVQARPTSKCVADDV